MSCVVSLKNGHVASNSQFDIVKPPFSGYVTQVPLCLRYVLYYSLSSYIGKLLYLSSGLQDTDYRPLRRYGKARSPRRESAHSNLSRYHRCLSAIY